MDQFEHDVLTTENWFDSERFRGITRLYTPRQVVGQQGTIANEYVIARDAASGFYDLLRKMYAGGKSITTFGPYSPGQAVAIKRAGIEGIYLGAFQELRVLVRNPTDTEKLRHFDPAFDTFLTDAAGGGQLGAILG